MEVSVKLFAFLLLLISISAYSDDYFKKKNFKRSLREVSVILTKDGFYPNKIVAFQGEKLRFFITSTNDTPQCLVLQKHELFLSAEKGKVNEGEIVVDNPGRYRFYCPSSKFEGHLNVIEKFKAHEEKPSREIASEKPNYWLPRNYDE